MENSVIRYAPWMILAVSFAVPAVFFASLPDEAVIARSFFGSSEILAPRSLFTVFRVPLIKLVCTLAILVMLNRKVSPTAQKSYRSMWLILLFTVSLKSLFQSLEMVSSSADAAFFYITIGVIIVGIISAAIPGRLAFTVLNRNDWKLSSSQKAALGGLLALYLGFAVVPMLVYR